MAEIANLNVRVGAKTNEFDTALSGVESKVQRFSQTINRIGAAMGIAFIFAAREMVQFGKEAAELEGITQGVEVAFKRLNDPELLGNLQRATGGTVSELQLMQRAVSAANFKIPMDILVKGLEFATRRAKETGQSVDYLTQSFVMGIGRKSALVMDNLGISVIELQKEIKKTGDFMTAVGNIMDREMKNAGSVIETSTDKAAKFKAALDDWKVTIGQDVNPILDKLREKLTTLFTFMSSDPTRGQALAFLEDFKELELKGKDLEDQMKLTAKAQAEFNEKYQQLSGDIIEKRGLGWPDEEIKGMKTMAEVYRVTAEVLSEYSAGLNKSTSAGESLEEIIARLNKQSKEREQLLAREIELENDRYESWKKIFGGIDVEAPAKFMKQTGIPGGAWGMGIELPEEELDKNEEYILEQYREWRANMEANAEGLAGNIEHFNQMIAESFYGLGEQIGAALGEMIATGEFGFNQFLRIAIDFAKNLGGIMIAMGIAKNVLLPGSGFSDIAAGIAISTIASGVGAFLSANQSSQGTTAHSSTQATYALSGTVSGRDLQIVADRQRKFGEAIT